MDPLSATASVIAILQLSAKVLSYLNDVKDTSKGRAQCAIEASNLHNLLTNLRFRLEEGHGRQSWFSAVQALAVENGPLDQFKQALETLQAKMTGGSRLEKVKEALVWKLKKEEVDAILARMERLKTLVEIALQMDHLKLSQAIKDDTGSIRTHVSAIQSAVNKVQQVQVTASQRILLEWISSSDYPAQQSDIIKRRQEGTGQWFLDAPEVARWLGDAKTTLLCPGIPGAGKTMVAAIAVDQLLDSAQNGAYGVAYVYCNYKSQADQDIVSIRAAILKQLVQSRPSALGPVERLHQKHAGRGTKPSLDDIYSALRDVLTQYPYVHIVIDALDECQNETRRQLCTKLLDLQKGADMRLMVTSRFVPDVEDAFRLASRLEVEASDEDVKQFVVGQIHRLPGCVQRSATLQKLVQERVVEAVGGIEALGRIEGQRTSHSKLAKSVLTWITFAKRPLTTAELCCALAVEPGEAELDPENKPDVDDIVSVCAGLVVVDQESAIIRLVHYTTQEYFERVSSRLNPDGQLEIAETCLTYLSFSVFESGSCATDEELEERLSRHELLDYAAKHGGEHARSVDAKVAYLACALVTQSGKFSCAAQVLFVPSYKYRGYSGSNPAVTGLHWIARFGLCSAAKEFLRRKDDETCAVNALDNDGEGSLMYAAKHGHCAMAELLLDKGANVNAQGGRYGNALQAASFKGHKAVVKLLLNKGANVNTQGGYFGNALQVFSIKGHQAVGKPLLNKGADVNAQGGYYGNALQAASSRGHEAVVKLLLNKGANVNAQGKYFGNALQAASSRGQRKGGGGNRCSTRAPTSTRRQDTSSTRLQAASFKGHQAVAKLLLNIGADVNAQGGYFGNALYAAAYAGNNGVLERLIERDSIRQLHDSYGRTLLWWAAAGGQTTTVQVLISRYNYNSRIADKFGRTPLWIATKKGHRAVSEFLSEECGPTDPGTNYVTGS
ncbi:unnamed protein product [Alternaria alternata]